MTSGPNDWRTTERRSNMRRPPASAHYIVTSRSIQRHDAGEVGGEGGGMEVVEEEEEEEEEEGKACHNSAINTVC